MGLRTYFRKKGRKWLLNFIPELRDVIDTLPVLREMNNHKDYYFDRNWASRISKKAQINSPYHIYYCTIDDYTYIAINSRISMVDIGKFCSIGPNFFAGYGIHPLNGISTSPMFYSTKKQNGTTLSSEDKIQERKRIHIGNDVFIGTNVTVIDGVTIGDGAIIGAGAVVTKDIPPYAIAVGCPIKVIKYRFNEEQRKNIQKLKWWDWDTENLRLVEKYFFDIEKFIEETTK